MATLSSYRLEKMMICQNGPGNTKEPAGGKNSDICVVWNKQQWQKKKPLFEKLLKSDVWG